MHRKQLSKSDIKGLNKSLNELCGLEDFFSKKDNVVVVETGGFKVVVRDKEILFFYYEGKLVPTLRLLLHRDVLKSVTVDMGAVKFMAKGADVMRPGIVQFSNGLRVGDVVVIVDETHGKPLAVGVMSVSEEKLLQNDGGKVIKNIHYVGDELWNLVV